jgi:hypothetical protein
MVNQNHPSGCPFASTRTPDRSARPAKREGMQDFVLPRPGLQRLSPPCPIATPVGMTGPRQERKRSLRGTMPVLVSGSKVYDGNATANARETAHEPHMPDHAQSPTHEIVNFAHGALWRIACLQREWCEKRIPLKVSGTRKPIRGRATEDSSDDNELL